MRHWLVRTGTRKLLIDKDRRHFTVWAKRVARFAVGDLIVLLDTEDDNAFSHVASVSAVQRPDVEGRFAPIPGGDLKSSNLDEFDPELKPTRVVLTNLQTLPEGLSREVMQFSLTIVRNLNFPNRHFSRGYRLLPPDDFKTLVVGDVFVARTAFLQLLKSLPLRLRVDFQVSELLSTQPTSGQQRHRDRLARLVTFLDERVFAAGRLISAIAQQAAQLDHAIGAANPVEHYFVREAVPNRLFSRSADPLSTQAQRFEALWQEMNTTSEFSGELSGVGFLDLLLTQLGEPQRRRVESRFEQLFRSAP
jgi:hypothetical protein